VEFGVGAGNTLRTITAALTPSAGGLSALPPRVVGPDARRMWRLNIFNFMQW
jgi:hypothetical protein